MVCVRECVHDGRAVHTQCVSAPGAAGAEDSGAVM